jgi:hypothetical protein
MEVRNWRSMRKRRMMQGMSGVRGLGVRIMEGKSRAGIWWPNRGHRMTPLISMIFQRLKTMESLFVRVEWKCHVPHQDVGSGVIVVLYRGV